MFCVELNPRDDGQLDLNILQTEHTQSYGLIIFSQLTMHARLAMGCMVGGFESRRGMDREFFFSKTVHTGSMTHPVSYSVATGALCHGYNGWNVMLTAHFHLVRR
jgi:hypothetical protein